MDPAPLPTPPPLPPAAPPPPKFTLPLVAWIAWGLYAVGMLVITLRAPGELSAFEWGRLSGNIVGVLVVPTLLAWLAWRLARRSNTARTVTFLAVFALFAAGQLLKAGKRGSSRDAFANVTHIAHESRAAQKAALEAGGSVTPEQSEKFVTAAAAELKKVAANSTGNERAAAEAAQVLTERLMSANRRYAAALEGLGADTFFQFSSLDTPEKISARRRAVEEFAAANAEMEKIQSTGADVLKAELERRAVSAAYVRGTLTGYEASSREKMPLILKIRATDARLATLMLEFLDLAEGKRGKWELQSDGNVRFAQDEAAARHRQLLEDLDALAAEQREYQLKLVGAAPAPTQRP